MTLYRRADYHIFLVAGRMGDFGSNLFSNALSPFTAALILFFVFIIIAGLLVWYALRRNDEVRAKFGHGKTIFEIETKKRRDAVIVLRLCSRKRRQDLARRVEELRKSLPTK